MSTGRGWKNWKLGSHRSDQVFGSLERKSDKETQSPKLQIFKDIMKRETNSKYEHSSTNSKKEKKKKNRSGSSKTTTDKRDSQLSFPQEEHIVVSRQESKSKSKPESDSKLKTRICPLLGYCRPPVMVFVCALFAFILLGACGYIVSCVVTPQTDIVMPSVDYLKKRSNFKHDRHRKSGLNDFIGLNTLIARHDWEDTNTNSKSGVVDLIGSAGKRARELASEASTPSNTIRHYADHGAVNNRFDSWAAKLNDEPTNNHLKRFYKRLLATDAQVQELRKSLVEPPRYSDVNLKYQERHKRSPKFKRLGRKKRLSREEMEEERGLSSGGDKREVDPEKVVDLLDSDENPLKTFKLYNKSSPVSIVMEKKKLYVQYRTENPPRKFAKCTHGGKEDSKHPYHKNTERLDRILDQIIGADAKYESVEELFKNKKSKCKHPKIKSEEEHEKRKVQPADTLEEMKKSEIIRGQEASNDKDSPEGRVHFSTQYEDVAIPSDFTMKDLTTSTTEGYRVYLAMTTMMDPLKRDSKHRSYEAPPISRKLLSVEGEEERLDLSYEDLKEVLADKVEDHDEEDRQIDKRMKRDKKMDADFWKDERITDPKFTPRPRLQAYRQNWNGAMPLYQDELNVVVSQANLPVEKKSDTNSEQREYQHDSNKHDMADIEDHFSKVDESGEAAQAYSDYGVFDGSISKGSAADKTHATATEVSFDIRSGDGDKRKMSLLTPDNKPSLEHKRHDQLTRVVLTAGRFKKSITEPEAIEDIINIANSIRNKDTTTTQAEEVKKANAKRNVEIVADKDGGKEGADSNPIFGLIFGMFSSTPSPSVEHFDGISKRSNGTASVGRLTRSLLSVVDSYDNITDNSDNNTEAFTKYPDKNETKISDGEIDNSTVIIIESATSLQGDMKDKRSAANGSMVKRNIDSKNHRAFWSDMYDDDYGVDNIPFDQVVEDQGNPKRNDLEKKSRSWLGKKMKRISGSLHRRTTSKEFMDGVSDEHRLVKREFRSSANEKDKEKMNFNSLHTKMREVCKKAVKEAQGDKLEEPGEVRDKSSTAAAQLMQQLVQLMSDLVDYQVQQRTCRTLPPDLQAFLQWLTSPATSRRSAADDAAVLDDDIWRNYFPSGTHRSKGSLDYESAVVGESDQARATYDELSKNIRGLEREYDAMSAADKEKLIGVKEHLQDQLVYLHRGAVGDLKKKRNTDANRITRNSKDSSETFAKLPPLHDVREKRTYLRNYGRKHTRSTASYVERVDSSLKYNIVDKSDEKNDEITRQKKNLRDVYYKALSDAIKHTTVRN